MSTGIQISDDCVKLFSELKMKHATRYLLLGMDDEKNPKSVVVLHQAARETTYKEFITSLPKDSPRYAIYDYEYDTPDGKRGKLILIAWVPDTASARHKMVFSGTKQSLREKLTGINFEIQATDMAEIDEQNILDKCKAFSK